jgi:GT2 family glycosyltransferase
MGKTLAVILHYNSVQYTDPLYELLEPEATSDYDLHVLNNGSDVGRESKYTTLGLERNVYFGGAINETFELMLNEPDYDSLLFLNSDLIVGKNFVSTLRKELWTQENFEHLLHTKTMGELSKISLYDIISPSIIQPYKIQNNWKQMLNWGQKEIREVRWIDLQAPLFSRRFIEKVKRFDDLLIYGWLIDVLCGIECEKLGWHIGVCDFVPAVHIGSATINDNKHKSDVADYCRRAEENQWIYSKRERITNKVLEMRKWAENYKI